MMNRKFLTNDEIIELVQFLNRVDTHGIPFLVKEVIFENVRDWVILVMNDPSVDAEKGMRILDDLDSWRSNI